MLCVCVQAQDQEEDKMEKDLAKAYMYGAKRRTLLLADAMGIEPDAQSKQTHSVSSSSSSSSSASSSFSSSPSSSSASSFIVSDAPWENPSASEVAAPVWPRPTTTVT